MSFKENHYLQKRRNVIS